MGYTVNQTVRSLKRKSVQIAPGDELILSHYSRDRKYVWVKNVTYGGKSKYKIPVSIVRKTDPNIFEKMLPFDYPVIKTLK